ncbi:class I SAM-dependent methyltransferase [Desulfosarcina ovata]|uniref:Methyltransferase n=1 Tax=Desulfosarcina ovata subsp. ovata TaxID=2752305 RepID=A0A5K8A3A0_9BACT|nr:class I SAM-dependent methyltransferase [Desulfosarcina ovata]BBO86916.1 methyltransferase [Desulfosarcina ovata subsp. ovata]
MKCRICNSSRLSLAIDLNAQPWANNFLKREEIGTESFYPLRVMHCADCKTVQLDHTVKKEIMFGNHTYLSGITKSLSDHFQKVAKSVDAVFFKNEKEKSALDIGSNDGTQLKHFQKLGYRVLGVESSTTIARIANDTGVETINAFFNFPLAQEINQTFKVINAAGVFFHLEELHSVTRGIKELLDSNGVFVVQFLYMKRIVENLAFDQIYHEHLLYYNLNTIDVLLNRHGLSMFDAYVSPIHGGSVIGFVTHAGRRSPTERLIKLRQREIEEDSNEFSTYQEFFKKIAEKKRITLDYLNAQKAKKKTIYGFGAPVKGNTMLNYFGTGTQYFDYLVEKNELRRGLYSPGMHIPIAIEKELKQLPDIYFVLAWNFKKEILKNNQHLLDKGIEFYFPVDPVETDE